MEGIILRLQKATEFLTPHLELVNSHMVEFFTNDLWERHVPVKIKHEYSEVLPPPNNLVDYFKESFICQDTHISYFLKQCAQFYPHLTDDIIVDFETLSKKIPCLNSSHEVLLSTNNTFMSEKKEHEVSLMGTVVAMLSNYTNSTHIIDIGDGRGYLSSHLVIQEGLKVLGIDCCHIKTLSAAKRASKMQKHLIKFQESDIPISIQNDIKQEDEPKRPNDSNSESQKLPYKQMTEFISYETDLRGLLSQSFPNEHVYKYGIVGLHTCGNLSPVCLKLFVTNKHDSNFLVNVGCCYHLLEEFNENEKCFTFPMSKFLKNKNFTLGRNARMLSLQAPDRLYSSNKVPESLMYRAVFESFLDLKIGKCETSEKQVGRIGTKCKNFEEYCRKALKKLGFEIDVTSNELNDFFESYKGQQHFLECFYMIRVTIAPVIEHIILLDRLLFLFEHGLTESYILKLFDSTTSPRGFAVISIKNS